MQLRFAAVCADARTTPEGRIDVQGVFHDLTAPGFPAQQDRLVLVMVLEWDRQDQGQYRFRADLEDDEGNVSLTVEGETEVRRPGPDRPPMRSQLVMPMEGIVFPHPGQYTFRLRVKGKTFDGPGIYLLEVADDDADRP